MTQIKGTASCNGRNGAIHRALNHHYSPVKIWALSYIFPQCCIARPDPNFFKQERERLIDELYAYLRVFFELTRQKEEKAIINKKIAKRRGPARPGEIAAQIYQEILDNLLQLFRQYEPDFLDKSKSFDTLELPADGEPEPFSDMFNTHGVQFRKGKTNVSLVQTKNPIQDDLIILLAKSGTRGLVRVPHEESECRRVLQKYERFILERDRRIRELIEERTADEDLQEKIYEALMPLFSRKQTT